MRKLPKREDLFSPEVLAQLDIALEEVGEIKPWYDPEVSAWVFEHPAYTERYAGDSPEEVIGGYPLYLGQLIQYRMQGILDEAVEKRITGRGGLRNPPGGRPKGSRKPLTTQIRVPADIARWLRQDPGHMEQVRRLMAG